MNGKYLISQGICEFITLEVSGNNRVGIMDEKYLLVSKDLDFFGDKMVFEGLRVAV